MSGTFTVKFIARKTKSDAVDSRLYVRVTLNQERREFGLRIKIPNNKWNSISQSVKGTTDEVKSINYRLDQIRSPKV
jgi:hypothetical protein